MSKPNVVQTDPIYQSLQQQIADLQSHVAYMELTIDSLDTVVTKQDKQLQDMQRQLQLLYAQLSRQIDSGIAPFDAASEVPPHY
ncbi:SlyX family protein [Psychrobacter sanguinis]|uniref:SlyX protein n=1 Tax=Psychrobacter sanguinis TaxID=861445 RepID=A0A844M2B8_9GAMM|nr:SlyX family protein [Psychrobacter sanguinis]MUG32875.1 SlyX protein [Psychrobacter sanguinis]